MSRPTIAEIAALTARLRELSDAGRDVGQAEVDRFLTDKHALLDRIEAADRHDADAAGDPQRDAVIGAASWAIAARDAAHDSGDTTAADRFAAEAAEAIAAAQRSGVSLGELAYELDYRGGVEAMLDGSSDAVEAAADPVDDALAEDAARFSDHLEPDPWDDYRIYTPDEAVAELVDRGFPADEAPGMVDRYYDSLVDERGWSSQDQWQIDDDELAVITDRATEAAAADEYLSICEVRPATEDDAARAVQRAHATVTDCLTRVHPPSAAAQVDEEPVDADVDVFE